MQTGTSTASTTNDQIFWGERTWRRGMSNAPLEVSQWWRPPVARSRTLNTGPINLTLEIALLQEQKKKEDVE